MTPLPTLSRPRLVVLAIGLALVLGGCASPPGPAPGTPSAATPGATAPGPATPAPAATAPTPLPPPPPEVPPAVARPQAQKLALEAVDQLQNGDETAARATLERALALDATNDLARKLQDQIRADAQKELGGTFFRYTVQRDDTLSKLAQQYLGDRFRFYILAKYNDIANPSRLAAGQVIRIPGKGPIAPPETTATTPPPAPPLPAAEPKRDDVAELMQKAADLEKSGNLEAAYSAYGDVLQRQPGQAEATKRRDGVRMSLVRTYDREASQAFQRQNLDLAIQKWDRVLELDPQNRKARLERERAIDLKKRMAAKFGGK
jgi:tetratricopeptide (TPR) repeat protein